MTEIFSTTDHDGDEFTLATVNTEYERKSAPLYVVTGRDGAYLMTKDAQALHTALGTWLEENKRELPATGTIRFSTGLVATCDAGEKAWRVTAHLGTWTAKELSDTFGPDWEELVVK